MFPGLSGTGVNTGESSQRLAVRKTCNVTDLSHKLWAESGADAVHCHDNRVFRAEAVSSIFWRRDSTVADVALSIATACRISIFVVLSFGNTAIRSEDLLYIASALLALKL